MKAKSKRGVDVHIRWMIRRDMAEVLDIERKSFDAAWTEEDFLRCLRQRNCIGMVSEERGPDKVIGYMIYELHKTKLVLLNFAVHPGYRRMGIGKGMVDKLKGKLSGQRRPKLALMARETNMDALLFFRGQGFLATSVERGFYEDTMEDAIHMEYVVDSDENPPDELDKPQEPLPFKG